MDESYNRLRSEFESRIAGALDGIETANELWGLWEDKIDEEGRHYREIDNLLDSLLQAVNQEIF